MPEDVVRYEVRDQVAVVTMNRPDYRNAQNSAMTYALDDAFYRAAEDDDVQVIVLAGAGSSADAVSAGTAPPDAADDAGGPTGRSPRQRAMQAVAAEGRGPEETSTDDSQVSRDDEDIEDVGAVGQPVIENVLGGTVIGELDQ